MPKMPEFQVTLVEFDYLSNVNRKRKNKTTYMVRCSVVKKKNNKLSVIATNQPYDEITSGKELADQYYNRWPCQEAKFKEMKKYCNLNVNHGFKKKEVFNRMADKRALSYIRPHNVSIKIHSNSIDDPQAFLPLQVSPSLEAYP